MRRWMAAAVTSAVMATTLGTTAVPATGEAILTARVRARDNFFQPRTITIERMTRVRWVSRGDNPHTTTSKTGLWDKDIPPGGSASRVFRKRGTFRYICTIHVDEGMRGKIIVT
jgi:plastocyanin